MAVETLDCHTWTNQLFKCIKQSGSPCNNPQITNEDILKRICVPPERNFISILRKISLFAILFNDIGVLIFLAFPNIPKWVIVINELISLGATIITVLLGLGVIK